MLNNNTQRSHYESAFLVSRQIDDVDVYKRQPLTAVTVTLYLFSILPVAGMLMQGLEKQYVPPALEKIIGKTDVVVVLGGGAVRDVPDISGREALSAVSMNRLITGVRLQKRLDIPIIISGGQVFADSGTEATVAEKVLLELSVPPQQIFTDTEARKMCIRDSCRRYG